jgi:quinol monooxygenase YgiN
MRRAISLLAGLAIGVAGLLPAAQAAEIETVYVVTYFEVSPAAQSKTAAMLKQFADQSRGDGGNLRFEVLQRIGQGDQFAMLEAWRGKEAFAAHAEQNHTRQFREKLAGMLRGPYDERPHTALEVGEVRATAGKDAVFAVTHVDIVPKLKDEGVGLTKDLAAAGRKAKGNVRFEALTQNSRPNHMTVVEIWTDRRAIAAHSTASHMKQYREKLLPMSGSLYDERLYKALN